MALHKFPAVLLQPSSESAMIFTDRCEVIFELLRVFIALVADFIEYGISIHNQVFCRKRTQRAQRKKLFCVLCVLSRLISFLLFSKAIDVSIVATDDDFSIGHCG